MPRSICRTSAWLLVACFTMLGSSMSWAEEAADAALAVARTLDPVKLDRLVVEASQLTEADLSDIVSDEQFLRRVSLDLIGRQPTPQEFATYLLDTSDGKRAAAVERLLASPEFGENWAGYWSDVIGYRVPPPELTFLDYTLFEKWLAERINQNAPWDETVRTILAMHPVSVRGIRKVPVCDWICRKPLGR